MLGSFGIREQHPLDQLASHYLQKTTRWGCEDWTSCKMEVCPKDGVKKREREKGAIDMAVVLVQTN